MYVSVKSRVKFCNNLGNEFYCSLGVRQGECLSPLLFSLYLNDLEEQFVLSGLNGLDVNTLKLFLLLYADGGWSGGAMVLGKLPVPGRPTIWITVGQEPIALAVGAGGGGLDIFTLIYPFSSFSLSLGDGPI